MNRVATDSIFGEQATGTAESQPMTLLRLVASTKPEGIAPLCLGGSASLAKELAAREIRTSYGATLLLHLKSGLFGFMMNHHYGSGLDVADITQATFETRQEIFDVVARLSDRGGIWEDLQLVATGEQIGAREGRRTKELYTVTADDIITGKRHEDAICQVEFPIDVHSTRKNAGKAFDDENNLASQPYGIPLRALISADRENLLMTGRCISADFIAHSSYWVTGNAVMMGEVAGALAARSAQSGCTSRHQSAIFYERPPLPG